jgi:hypothetical protein
LTPDDDLELEVIMAIKPVQLTDLSAPRQPAACANQHVVALEVTTSSHFHLVSVLFLI